MSEKTFDVAYAAFLQAKANLYKIEAEKDNEEEDKTKEDAIESALDELRNAEWKLIQTPALSANHVKTRAME